MDQAKSSLESNARISIEQAEDKMESYTLGFCGEENVYSLTMKPGGMGDSREIVKIKEESPNIPCRCLLPPRCRAFEATVVTADDKEEVMFKYKKEWGWPIMMFCRPKFQVFDKDNTCIGWIENECGICQMTMHILNDSEERKYTITATMLNLGFLCNPLLGGFFALEYSIQDAKDNNQELAKFSKAHKGIFTECFCNDDKYDVTIPESMDFNDRVLLAAAVHELDMLYFERKPPCAGGGCGA